MISIPRLLTTARRFVDGVCAIPDKGRVWYLNCLVDERDATISRMAEDLISVRRWFKESQERRVSLSRERDALESELVGMARQRDSAVDDLQQQLAAEREAHEETKQRWATVSDEWNGAAEECIELRNQLSAARCWSDPCGVCGTRFDTLIYPRCPVCSGGPVQLTPVSIVEMIPCGRCGSRPNADEPQYDTITICPSCNRDRESRCEQLSAARADLEALTVWKLQSEKPCPVFEPSEYVVAKESDLDAPGHVLDKFAREYMYWRHSPSSLAAWKAREGGGE